MKTAGDYRACVQQVLLPAAAGIKLVRRPRSTRRLCMIVPLLGFQRPHAKGAVAKHSRGSEFRARGLNDQRFRSTSEPVFLTRRAVGYRKLPRACAGRAMTASPRRRTGLRVRGRLQRPLGGRLLPSWRWVDERGHLSQVAAAARAAAEATVPPQHHGTRQGNRNGVARA